MYYLNGLLENKDVKQNQGCLLAIGSAAMSKYIGIACCSQGIFHLMMVAFKVVDSDNKPKEAFVSRSTSMVRLGRTVLCSAWIASGW